MKKLSVYISAITLGIVASTSYAESCSAEQIDSENCRTYIQGFLEGALITDTAIVQTITDEQSDFFQRAYKTRTSGSRENLPATYLARFCLTPDESQSNLIDEVVNYIKGRAMTALPLNQVVYNSLKSLYPCETDI